MSMMDLQGALGGAPPPGAPPGGPPGGGALPDLGAALGAGPPPGQDNSQATGSDQFSSSLEALQAAEEALKAFIELDPDHSDRAIAAQCLQNVLKLQASNQDSAQSGDLTSLKRALAQGPAGTGGVGGAGGAAPPDMGGGPPGAGGY